VVPGSGPLTRNFTGQPTGGPELERADATEHVVEAGLQGLLEARLHAGALLEPLGDDHGLREEIVGKLRIEGQVKADRPLADVEAPVGDVGILFEQLLDAGHHLLRGIERGVLRQRQIDQQLGPVGGREELLLHEAHADERQQEECGGAGQHAALAAQRAVERAMEPARETRSAVSAVLLDFVGQDEDAGQGRKQHGHDPGHDQRDADHGEQREAIFAGAAFREADRHEAGDRHQRTRQHGKGGGRVGVGRGRHLVVAFLELGNHHFDGDHGVVDQQAEGNDQSAERNALQRDAEQFHQNERHPPAPAGWRWRRRRRVSSPAPKSSPAARWRWLPSAS
jgi:hypothetical protein